VVEIFNIIITPEHIFLVACNFPPSATLLPSPRSAVCIITTSIEEFIREISVKFITAPAAA
jgi:hypothetical protein